MRQATLWTGAVIAGVLLLAKPPHAIISLLALALLAVLAAANAR